MKKDTNFWLLAAIGVLILLTIIVVGLRAEKFACCSCPPGQYEFYPLIQALNENSRLVQCDCPPNAGCTFSFWIIPSDLIALIVILSAVFAYRKWKKK
ncbi:MAG: hypothetical protein V1494_02670 [Candidatus Diapherotrites archaeon]